MAKQKFGMMDDGLYTVTLIMTNANGLTLVRAATETHPDFGRYALATSPVTNGTRVHLIRAWHSYSSGSIDERSTEQHSVWAVPVSAEAN